VVRAAANEAHRIVEEIAMTDSARIHTWGCERHKEDTYEGCYSCDLADFSELSSKVTAAVARIAKLEKALSDVIETHKAVMNPFASSAAYLNHEKAVTAASSLMER
jgi:hypothetical protein